MSNSKQTTEQYIETYFSNHKDKTERLEQPEIDKTEELALEVDKTITEMEKVLNEPREKPSDHAEIIDAHFGPSNSA